MGSTWRPCVHHGKPWEATLPAQGAQQAIWSHFARLFGLPWAVFWVHSARIGMIGQLKAPLTSIGPIQSWEKRPQQFGATPKTLIRLGKRPQQFGATQKHGFGTGNDPSNLGLTMLGHIGAILGSSWDHLGHLGQSSGQLGKPWGHIGVILALLDHLRFTLAILGRHIAARLGPFWGFFVPCRVQSRRAGLLGQMYQNHRFPSNKNVV
jgi:hypothetical protein